MNLKVKFTDDSRDDLYILPPQLQVECIEMLKKLSININLGKKLENKNGRDLSDCYKLYFDNARYRIVYRKINDTIEINGILSIEKVAEVLGIGERNLEYIYSIIANRLGR